MGKQFHTAGALSKCSAMRLHAHNSKEPPWDSWMVQGSFPKHSLAC